MAVQGRVDEPLTMEGGGETFYYHRDALGSVTEVTDSSGTLVERYEYDVYGEVLIFDGSDNPLAASAIGNPYLFTGRRYDPESGNYYYRTRMYSPSLGRFLSMDPLGFEAGDYNLYRYVFNNPTNLTDPTGEFAFLPILASMATEAAVDALSQLVLNYYFDDRYSTWEEAFYGIDLRQVGLAAIIGVLPGGRAVKAALESLGTVFLNWLDAYNNDCEEYPFEQMIVDFGQNFITHYLIGKGVDAIAKYGLPAIKKGLMKMGFDETTVKKWLKRLGGGGRSGYSNPKKLIPNPDDPFNNPAIGESWERLKYHREYILQHGTIESPIEVVETPKGYMILNGHHRWKAALQLGLKKVPIIINK